MNDPRTTPRPGRRTLVCAVAALSAIAVAGCQLTGPGAGPSPAAGPAAAAPQPLALPVSGLAGSAALAPQGPRNVATDPAEFLDQQQAAGLSCTTTDRGQPICVHGGDHGRPEHVAPPVDLTPVQQFAEQAGSGLGCYGDGTSGPRVRAVYARPQGSADSFAAALPSLRSWAAAVDAQFDRSAQRTGGRRHVRFATTAGAGCQLTVQHVVLPVAAFSSFRATIDALQAQGLDTASSKYLVWADSSQLCGIATTFADGRPGPENVANSTYPSYARIDKPCWGHVEAHELVHMLGGVQPSAPNSTGGFHCSDGFDVMCYDDQTARSTQRSVCGEEGRRLLDCRNDDYFHTSPASGSYLQTRWNVASSAFLSAELTEPAPTRTPPSPSPAPSPAPTREPAPEPSRPAPVTPPVPTAPVPPVPTLPALPLPTLPPLDDVVGGLLGGLLRPTAP